MTDVLQRLRADLFVEQQQWREKEREAQVQMDIRSQFIARIDALLAEAPSNPAPAPNGRAPRRDLQSIVLVGVRATPLSVAQIHDNATGSGRAGDITEGSVKRVLDALVKKGKVAVSGDGYMLPVDPYKIYHTESPAGATETLATGGEHLLSTASTP